MRKRNIKTFNSVGPSELRRYVVKATWNAGSAMQGFLNLGPENEIYFVTHRSVGTVFFSRVLAHGWMMKAKAHNKTYTMSIVEL